MLKPTVSSLIVTLLVFSFANLLLDIDYCNLQVKLLIRVTVVKVLEDVICSVMLASV